MAYFELDDVFTYQDANDIKKLWAAATAPSDPGTGEVWLDTSVTPNKLKRYNGTGWDTIGEVTGADVLNLLGTTTANVGIGTTSPAVQLEVETTGENAALRVERTDGATAEIMAKDDGITMGSRENHDLILVTNNDPKLTIDTAGNVGIGTSSPAYPLELETTGGNAAIVAERTDGASAYISGTDAHGAVGTATNHDLKLLTNSNVRMTVDTSGNLGIGTANPGSKLEVNGDAQISGKIMSQMFVVTLANNEILDTGISRYSVGYIYIRNSAGGNYNGAIFRTGVMVTSAYGYGVSRVAGANAYYSNTKDNTSINVYGESSGNVKVQNISGGSKTLHIGFMGAYFG